MLKAYKSAFQLALLAFVPFCVQGETIYYHNDLAGSPVAATNAQGQVIWRESYRPYGERLNNSAAASSNTTWFTSRRQDAESGLIYMGARYYDPVIGRFMSPDPVQFVENNFHSFNRYAYANNNPYRYIDPDGREAYVIYHRAAWDSGANPMPFNHATIVLIPNNPGDFTDRRGWQAATEGDGIVATLGAQPGGPNLKGPLGNLTFAPNYSGDSLEKGTGAVTLQPPKGMSDTQWINSLINAAGSYKDDARYGLSPPSYNEVYNSNSFVAGVIQKAGGVPPHLPVSVPGYDKPLPLGR